MMRRFELALLTAVSLSVACVRGGGEQDEPKPKGPKAYTGDQLPALAEQGTPQAGGVLRVAMEAEPPTLNYQLDPMDAWGKRVHELIYEPMARRNPTTWVHEPRLAERWTISDDRLTFTFFLRKGVTWHDGEAFDADDVVFTFDKLREPTSKTVAIRSYLEPIAKIKRVDAHTVRFEMKRPYWFAFDAIAEIYIYPQHVFGKGDFNTHPANRAPRTGIGRFKFVRWKLGDEIVLARNDDFFGAKAHLDQIVFRYAPDPTVRVQMLRRGDVDVVLRLSPEAWRNITEDPQVAERFWRLRHVPNGLQWIGWNQQRPMFADRRVRRAMTMLIDREDIVQNLRLGLDAIATSWFYRGSEAYNEKLEPVPYDPEAARKLLDEAGWKDSDGDGVREKNGKRFEFSFVYPVGNTFYEQLASLMATELSRSGVSMQTARLEWAVFTERLRRHEFDACSLLWQQYPESDPYQIWHSSAIAGGSNFISFKNAEVDRLIVAAREEFDEARRIAAYKRFSEVLYEEQPYTMLFNRYNLSIVSKRFGGIVSTPYGLLRLDDMYLRTRATTGSKP